MTFDLPKIVQTVNGRLLPAGALARINGVSTDSRTVAAGNLFVALKGPNFDGHQFLAVAAQQGAAAAICEHPVPDVSLPQIIVSDTLRALGDLAAAWRRQFELPIAAITGSSGKTTTKEMLAAILGIDTPGLKTEGNFNNLIGLPLTVFKLSPTHRWAVLEMGMSERGEIARLAEIAAPTVGLVTNVAAAHLSTLKSLDGVARAKGELFVALQPGSSAVVNSDDERVLALPVANGVRRILYGLTDKAEVRAEEIATIGTTVRFRLCTPVGTAPVQLNLPGRHNVANALAATAAALTMGSALEAVVAGLEAFRPTRGRMETVLLANDILLLEDTYNANPLSVKAALAALNDLGAGQRRIAILGDMLELGENTAELHREVGSFAATHCDCLIVLGAQAEALANGARSAGMSDAVITVVASHDQANAQLAQLVQPGDRILVKGSRGMKMERIAVALRERFGELPGKG